MNLIETGRVTMQAWTATKKLSCEVNRGPKDLIPQVDTMHRSPTGLTTHRVALVPDRDDIPTAVGIACEEAAPGATLAFVASMGDAHIREVPEAEAVDLDNGRGSVTRAFHDGDLSVQEALIVLVIDAKTNEMVVLSRNYTYRDNGLPKFGQVITADATETAVMDGAVRDRLLTAIKWGEPCGACGSPDVRLVEMNSEVTRRCIDCGAVAPVMT